MQCKSNASAMQGAMHKKERKRKALKEKEINKEKKVKESK